MKLIILSSFLLLSISSLANSRARIKDQISRLAVRIDESVYETEATTDELRRAQARLRDVLSTLNGSGTGYPSCLDFALPILERRYTSSTAVRKAKEICSRVGDAEVFEFLYHKLVATYIDTTALKKASELATRDTLGKKRIIEFSFEKHMSQYTTGRAIEKSLDNARILEVGSLRCLQRFFSTYSRSYSSSRAMDKTAESCSQN
jgi:hypothetical protein